MATPMFGEGTVLQVNDGTASAYEAIADVLNIDPPDNTVIEIDRNRLSVTTMTEKAFSGRLELGQLSFTYEADATAYSRIEALKKVSKGYKVITAGTNQTLAFTGILLSNKRQGIQGQVIDSAVATVRLVSLITLT